MPFEVVNKHMGRFDLRYNLARIPVQTEINKKLISDSLIFRQSVAEYSVIQNLSSSIYLLSGSHLDMYQAYLYLKPNLTMCLFTTSKGIKIGQPSQEESEVSKNTVTV